ncbi:MAG: EF-hand domain-containing protein [Oligoflexales bacterium]|nr:EF-hand domain-containing protein [Oligoflexales bacterium]
MFLRCSGFLMVLVLTLSGACTHHGHSQHGSKWKEMDTDKNGKVTKEEFLKLHDSYFAKHDLDNDGVVTEEEIKSCHEGKMKKASESSEAKSK